ncbi:ADP-ribose glycohydrolase MACROD2 isoform X1 [Erpetoichthys calabaricus]|uniref:ADP-ribose glycohydrolase MACROD2 isoform X1 n=1 Tax=Erpetoichthys calabaricus TaxID=27687 RepID=UPI00109F65FF|nr:ADP-ribose glycohydrolase MACROD2 isoform X1 [Erpetoichthys calabaricus]
MSKKKKDWRLEKERLLGLGLEERRKEYGNYVPLEKIPSWRKSEKNKEDAEDSSLQVNVLSEKVSLYKGDITLLEIDAIVNAANSSLLGGGGVDGCIHRAAGLCLLDECQTLNGCETGNAKITCGYDLPAKYVIHTVGPVARGHVGKTQKDLLAACYDSSLNLLKENGLRSVAFPCISTGIYGFPNEPAAEIALETVQNWIKKNSDEIERVIFCVFLETDHKIYKEKMTKFFSTDNDANDESGKEAAEEKKEEEEPKSPKKEKLNNGEDSGGEGETEEEEEGGHSNRENKQVESLKGEEDQSDTADIEMESQDLGQEKVNLNETENKEESEEDTAQVNNGQDREESKGNREKDEVASQLMENEKEAAVHPSDDSALGPEEHPKDTWKQEGPADGAVVDDAVKTEDTEHDEDMNTQVEESQEMQVESNPSKDETEEMSS